MRFFEGDFQFLEHEAKSDKLSGCSNICSAFACHFAEGACRLLLAGFWLGVLFDSEDGNITSLRNVGGLLSNYTALHPGR
jgi:Zn-finger protein